MVCVKEGSLTKCPKGLISFSSLDDPTNPLTAHVWKLDGQQVSTQKEFSLPFNIAAMHTVEHTGTNACGAGCTKTEQLQVIEGAPPPSSGAGLRVAGIFLAELTALGLGLALLGGRK